MALEELHPDHPEYAHVRSKRFALNDDDADGHLVVYSSPASGGECGIKPKNAKRMRRPKTIALELDGSGKSCKV